MADSIVRLPKLHEAQMLVESEAARFNALACGRRWGKTKFLTRDMARTALRGERYGYFAPNYKLLREVFNEAAQRLAPIARVLKQENRIELPTAGLIEFWTLEDENAGRSRWYDRVGVDEAGMVPGLEQIWHNAIRPTLTDRRGTAWLAGTPKGRDYFHTAYALGQDSQNADWKSWQMPTSTNPYIDPAEIAEAKTQMPDRSFRQEFLAEFIEEAGGVFRGVKEAVMPGVRSVASEAVSIGIDIARIEDFTVLSAVDASGRQIDFDRFNQISWERIYSTIRSFIERHPAAAVWMDSTGVGEPVYDRVKRESPNRRINPYSFTSDSKGALIDNLAMRLEQQTTRILDIPEQTNELLAYQYEMTKARNIRMNAPPGMHDDTVIALALAVWGLGRGRRMAVVY